MNPSAYSWKQVLELETTMAEEYIEQGILSPGNVWLIVAPQASYKSIVAMNIAAAVSKGEPVLGQLKTHKPRSVLYLDKEVGLRWMQERIQAYSKHESLSDNLFLATKGMSATNINLDDYKTLDPLEKALESTQAEVLILDCLNPLLKGVESEETFKAVERSINTINLKFPNLAIILIHHMREIPKEIDPLSIYNSRSSTKLTDWAATRMTMAVTKQATKESKNPSSRLRARFYLRHGPQFEIDFWVDEHFRVRAKEPKLKSLEGL